MSQRFQIEAGSEPFPGHRLVQPIGKGGFAEVWEAERAGERIALKFISSGTTTTTVKEIKSLQAVQKLSHPGIIQMEHITSIPGYIVISMELAEGSLLELFDAFQVEFETPIELKLLLDYMLQAAEALDYMNSRQHCFEGRKVGFQHCDVKPSNFLLFGDKVKACDFGLSTPTFGTWTPVGRMGTLDFAAPEMHRGMLSERSDQYSFAVSYYYMRTGRFPFPPPPTNRFVRNYSYTRPHPDLRLVPSQEEAVILRALDMSPDLRWPTCKDMIRRIREIHGFGASRSGAGSSAGNSSAGTGSRAGLAAVTA